MKHYQAFKDQLLVMIENQSSSQQMANFVATNQYCDYLCAKVANKYNLDANDLFADLIVAILEGTILNPKIMAERKFSGHFFEFRVIDLARKALSPQMDEISDLIAVDIDLEIEAIQRFDTSQQKLKLDKLITHKIEELNQYQREIGAVGVEINLKQYCEVTHLSIEELAARCELPRHTLTRNLQDYKHLLVKLLGCYTNLYQYWCIHHGAYLAEIIQKYDGLFNVYRISGFSCSYRKFQKSIKAMNVWHLEKLRVNLEAHNV